MGIAVFAAIVIVGFVLIPGIAFAFIIATVAYLATRDLYTSPATA